MAYWANADYQLKKIIKMEIKQDYNIVSTCKTVEWLIEKTHVSTFDPISFAGYQRQVDKKHCLKIVDYLKKGFWMPGSIICACDNYSDDSDLRIVDGQHRVAAFRELRERDTTRYNQIKDMQVSVIVLVDVPQEVEIDTFITINKTSKKVDTSLAYVLKNKISGRSTDMVMSRTEYIAVECARVLNDNESYYNWNNRILYEGSIKQSHMYISLNSFVRATRVLINYLNKAGVVSLDWSNNDDVSRTSIEIADLIDFIWRTVYTKWPDVYEKGPEARFIIQGSLGYTAIIRTLVKLMKEESFASMVDVRAFFSFVILNFGVQPSLWFPGELFSKFSSEAGYKYVSDELIKSMKRR